MRDSLKHLIEVACNVKVLLGVCSYTVNEFNEYSFIEFHTQGMIEPRRVLDLAGSHLVRMYASGDDLIIKIYDEEV